MKVLHINASYKPAYIYGGPTYSVSKLCKQLVKNGCNIEVFTTTANGTTELPVIKNIPQQVDGVSVRYFKRFSKDHSHFSPYLLITLWNDIRSFEVVHIHAWWNLVSILSCLIAHIRGVPVVLSPRGTLSPYSFAKGNRMIKQFFHFSAGRFLLNRCHIHTTSEREEQAITQLLKPLSVFNSYNLVNLPAHLPLRLKENSPLRLLFLSRIQQKKGIELLFKAISELKFPYQLSMAGDGDKAYLKKIKKLSLRYQIAAHISWLGFRDLNKFELMAQHHVLVLPSYDESFGNVVIESLSVGTAVLISNKVGLATFVRKNNLGWICKTSSESVRDSLSKIYGSPGMLDIIAEYAPAMIVSQFNDDKLIGPYLQLYQQAAHLVKVAHA